VAIHDRPQELFRVLNGLGPADRLNTGDSVKIVVE
jgi:predicted Zn-dependent protease